MTRGPATALDEQAIRSVLVVDDSRAQRGLLKSLLTRWGMQVHLAESGEQALDVIRAEEVDLILSDWMMPGITGVELCRRFRLLDLDRYVYFVLLTSKSEKAAVTEGLTNGADDFLVKPVGGEELRARILAADRIISMERELQEKNRLVKQTLGKLQRAHVAIDRDLTEARKLQQSLVPRQPLSLATADISFLFQPSGHVGGDFVGRIPVTNNQFGLYSIDVSGHGVASAMITARLAATLGSALPEQNAALELTDSGISLRDPEETCRRLNEQFLAEMDTDLYFTMALAHADMATGRVRFVQAGHPNPLVQRADGSVCFLGAGGMPLGLIPDADFEVTEVYLAPGDRLFLYSDGVTECAAPDGEMLEEEGLERIFGNGSQLRGDAFLDYLKWQLNAYLEEGDQPDDVSGVLVEWR